MSGSRALVYPVMAQVGWTFVVFIVLGIRRYGAVRRREVRLRDLALSDDAWPDDARKASNNLRNQFETPILFYSICGFGTYVGSGGVAMGTLAWVYVLCRVVHTAVHTTINSVPARALVFAIGTTALFMMWIGIIVHMASE